MRVEATGFRQTIAVLKELGDEAGEESMNAIKQSAGTLRDEARSLVDPVGLSSWGAWRTGYDSGRVRAGIKLTRGKFRERGTTRSNVVGVVNQSAPGVIWELAGRRTSAENSVFVRNIQNRSGRRASRLLYAAADSTQDWNRDQAEPLLQAAADKATKAAQAKLGAIRHG